MDSSRNIVIETRGHSKTYKGVQPLPSLTPVLGTTVMTILFAVVALWRFRHEEF